MKVVACIEGKLREQLGQGLQYDDAQPLQLCQKSP